MKVIPVKDKKLYEAVDGNAYEKKRDAAKVNEFQARAHALTQLLTQYYPIENAAMLSATDCVSFFAEHGDEVIEALTEE